MKSLNTVMLENTQLCSLDASPNDLEESVWDKNYTKKEIEGAS